MEQEFNLKLSDLENQKEYRYNGCEGAIYKVENNNLYWRDKDYNLWSKTSWKHLSYETARFCEKITEKEPENEEPKDIKTLAYSSTDMQHDLWSKQCEIIQ